MVEDLDDVFELPTRRFDFLDRYMNKVLLASLDDSSYTINKHPN